MRRITWSAALAALFAVLAWGVSGLPGIHAEKSTDATTPNTLTSAEKEKGWKLLFDGKTTTGWRAYRGKDVPSAWKVVDGVLIVSPKNGNGGDIVTLDEYDNFELVFDWKVTPGANSGVMYRVAETQDEPYFTGPEYQVLDNKKHPDGRNPKTAAASVYAVYAPSEDAAKPVGEWNAGKIVANGNHLEHWLNGVKVVDCEIGSEDWNKRIAQSKWKDVPTYAREKKGHIDLQFHGDEVAFRNIKIRPLTEK